MVVENMDMGLKKILFHFMKWLIYYLLASEKGEADDVEGEGANWVH